MKTGDVVVIKEPAPGIEAFTEDAVGALGTVDGVFGEVANVSYGNGAGEKEAFAFYTRQLEVIGEL